MSSIPTNNYLEAKNKQEGRAMQMKQEGKCGNLSARSFLYTLNMSITSIQMVGAVVVVIVW